MMKKEFLTESTQTALNPRIADIAHRLNSLEIGGKELVALEWLTANPDEFGKILRDVYRYCG